MMDQRIEGVVRERILISFYRSKGSVEYPDIDAVLQLCRATGWKNEYGWLKKPNNYPEEYFSRIPLPKDVINLILNRLRTDDLYLQLKYYPSPEQRSTALSQMAGECFVILFFVPEVLKQNNAMMNEIVNRFFYDNWVISHYMGNRVDLTAAWDSYKAARNALNNVLTEQVVKGTIEQKTELLEELTVTVHKYLEEGVLGEDFVIDNLSSLLSCLRNSNCTIRWIMLHLTTTSKKFAELVNKAFSQEQVLAFLLIVAQLELTIKNLFASLLASKQSRWDKLKGDCTEIIAELADFFSGTTPMSKITKNEDLEKWFREILVEITNLDYREPVSAGRKAAKMIAALEEVEQYQQIESSLQIRQFLQDVRNYLQLMIRTINCREETQVNINVVSDMSYAWDTAANYIQLMQQKVREEANIVSKLRATFLKLSTMLEFPLMRIIQGKSPDQESVAQYYSSKLVAFVRSVLEVVPASLFSLMSDIIHLQTRRMQPLPPKFAKDSLKDFAQLELRTELSKMTYSVVAFTDGILEMEATTMGVIEIDPKRLLEDGVRKELVKTLTKIYHNSLFFPQSGKVSDFEKRLTDVYLQTSGLKASFEYVQDYIGLYGLKLWQEESQRMANFFVEQEGNLFLKKKIFEWQSDFQSEAAPIPLPPSPAKTMGVSLADKSSVSFLGRVTRELIELTSPSHTIYSSARHAWVDKDTRTEIAGTKLFALMYSALDVALLSGVDKLLCFMITSSLTNMMKVYKREVTKPVQTKLNNLSMKVAPPGAVPQTQELYVAKAQTLKLIPKLMNAMQDCVMKIGHYQLLRLHIQSRLNAAIHLESGVLAGTLSNFNKALLLDVEQHYIHPDTAPYPSQESPLLPEVSKFLEAAGMGDPLSRVYVAGELLPSFDYLMFVLTCEILGKMVSDPKMPGVLVGKSSRDGLDGVTFATGLATMMKQFHSAYTTAFLERYGQLVKALYTDFSHMIVKDEDITPKSRINMPPGDLHNLLWFLPELKKKTTLPDEMFDQVIPKYIFESI